MNMIRSYNYITKIDEYDITIDKNGRMIRAANDSLSTAILYVPTLGVAKFFRPVILILFSPRRLVVK